MKTPMVGDVVRVRKWVLDRWYGTTGCVVRRTWDERRGIAYVYVDGDWYPVRNDGLHTCRVVQVAGYVWPMIIMIMMLAAASMACLETFAIADDHVVPTTPAFVTVDENPAGAVYGIGDDVTITPTLSLQGEGEGAQRSCAVVIAAESLHVRGGPSEDDIVLSWLLHGDIVRVIDRSRDDWWLVDFNGRTGYARAMYLEERAC